MLSTKKAQGMSLNTVIIAIIVLVVLVVLIMIFTGYFGKIFTPSVKACSTAGGECASACGTGQLGSEITSADCSTAGEGLKCCSRIQDVDFNRQEGVASCERQGGDCESATKPNPATGEGQPLTIPATCTDYSESSLNAPGCPSGKICCK